MIAKHMLRLMLAAALSLLPPVSPGPGALSWVRPALAAPPGGQAVNPVTAGLLARTQALAKQDALPLVAEFEGGRLHGDGKVKVVVLSGGWERMGRQYGALLAGDIKGMRDEIVRQYLEHKVAASEEEMAAFCERLMGLHPARFQAFARGVAQTSGASGRDLALTNGFFEMALASPAKQATNHCSAMTAWGDFTAGGALVMGRNFDFAAFYKKFSPYLVVTVFRPDDGGVPAAGISYAGQFGSISTFNAAGLTLENNDGAQTGDKDRYFLERTPYLLTAVELMLAHATLEGLDRAMGELRIAYPLIFNVADGRRAITYEVSTRAVERRDASPGLAEGLLVATNTPLLPVWTAVREYPDYYEDSMTRYRNLAALGAQYKGAMTDRAMMAILDTAMEDGGPTPSSHHKDTWQYVWLPGELGLWLKAAGHMDWTYISLGRYF